MQQAGADRERRPTRRSALAGAGAAALAAGIAPARAARRPIPVGSAAEIGAFRGDARYRTALKRYCDVVVPMNDLK